ncbi:hypothetical protein Tco_1021001 [Tanacetum coccineum]
MRWLLLDVASVLQEPLISNADIVVTIVKFRGTLDALVCHVSLEIVRKRPPLKTLLAYAMRQGVIQSLKQRMLMRESQST